MDLHCKDCKFFSSFGEEYAGGLCRRNPPVLVKSRDGSVFPDVNGERDWCGEHSSLPPRGAADVEIIRDAIERFLGAKS